MVWSPKGSTDPARLPSAPFREEGKTLVAATVEQLAVLVRGKLAGDGSVPINSARPVDEAGPGDITFVESERYARHLKASPASAAIVGPHFKMSARPEMPVIEVEDPISAFLAVRTHLVGASRPRWTGIHRMAAVADSATIGEQVAIHAFVSVGEDSEIGEGSTLHPGAVIGDRCKLGRNCIIHPNAVLYSDVTLGDNVEVHAGSVIGGDGFKYHMVEGKHLKVPHTGKVEVGDDVEIGSNCTIEVTRIGAGTKIDNLVMIGHNNHIGRHNLLCGQVGIAGSCKTGDYVVMAGQAGIKDHTEIGDKVMIGAQAGVHRNVPSGQNLLGSPAIPIREQRRIFQMIARLPEMHRQLRELATQIAILTAAGPHPIDGGQVADDDPTGF